MKIVKFDLFFLLFTFVSCSYAEADSSLLKGKWTKSIQLLQDKQTFVWTFSGKNYGYVEQFMLSHETGGLMISDRMNFLYDAVPHGDIVPGLFDVDIVFQQRIISGDAEVLNRFEYCGFKDWKIGELRDVSSASCDGAPPVYALKYYAVAKVEGNLLSVGGGNATSDCLTPEQRCKDLFVYSNYILEMN